MNVRLIRAAQFLRQFNLVISHKSDKEHIMPNTLLRLASLNKNNSLSHYYSKLNALFTTSLIEISSFFHEKCIQDYQ